MSTSICLRAAPSATANFTPSKSPSRPTSPEVWPDIRFPTFVDDGKYRCVNFWFGPGNNVTPLHYDPDNNFLAQIRGRKQVILCPPREIARLCPLPAGYVRNYVSQVNMESPDLTQFPGWADVDRAVIELSAGDMLFIPVYWWHAVWGIGENMSINYWWRCRLADLLQNPRQTTRLLGPAYQLLRGAMITEIWPQIRRNT